MTDATYTIRSWNGSNPEDFGEYAEALAAARQRAMAEGRLVTIRDNPMQEVREVKPDGALGKTWHYDGDEWEWE